MEQTVQRGGQFLETLKVGLDRALSNLGCVKIPCSLQEKSECKKKPKDEADKIDIYMNTTQYVYIHIYIHICI